MKRYLAIGLLFVSSQSVAIECGPIMRTVTIDQMRKSLQDADRNLSGHSQALIAEVKGRLQAARSNEDMNSVGELQNEIDLVSIVSLSAERVISTLDTAWSLALVRDKMIDPRDRTIASGFLSIQLAGVARIAQGLGQNATTALTKVTKPGVAVDLAKMRDTIGTVATDLAKCTSPSRTATQ